MRSLGKRLRSARWRVLLDQTSVLFYNRQVRSGQFTRLNVFPHLCLHSGRIWQGRDGGPCALAPTHSLVQVHSEGTKGPC